MKKDIRNRVQSLLLVLSMASILGLTGWLIGGLFIAILAVGLTFLIYIINPLISPFWIAKMHRGRPLYYDEAPRLFQVLEELSQRAGLKALPKLYYLPGDGMNAFAAGTDDNAVIAISEDLIQRLNLREIASILAHEISHLRYNDIRILRSAQMITQLTHQLSFIGQLLLLFNLPMILFGGYTVSWIGIFLLIIAPSISILLQLALSRTREYRADLGAVELLGDPEPLASALAKIERYQRKYFRWMFLPTYKQRPHEGWFQTHPATAKRIQKLLEINDRRYNANNLKIAYPYQATALEKGARLWNPLLHGWNS
jgi:heat shock protein HtpX